MKKSLTDTVWVVIMVVPGAGGPWPRRGVHGRDEGDRPKRGGQRTRYKKMARILQTKWEDKQPIKCALCGFTQYKYFVFGVVLGDSWKIMCPTCHDLKGIGFGPQRGELYEKTAGNWIQIL